jgi:hypothetical protein
MLYREINAVCSEIHTKHINTRCGQNGELLNVKLVVHTVTPPFKGHKTLLQIKSTLVYKYQYLGTFCYAQ